MRRLAAAVLVVPLALLPAACGSEQQSAADQVPALSAGLDRVDAAVTAHRYRVARERIGDLVDATVAARDAGDLDPAAADRILASAAQLLSSLPVVIAPTTLSPTPTPTPAPKPAPEVDREPKKKPGDGPDGHGRPGKGRDKDDD